MLAFPANLLAMLIGVLLLVGLLDVGNAVYDQTVLHSALEAVAMAAARQTESAPPSSPSSGGGASAGSGPPVAPAVPALNVPAALQAGEAQWSLEEQDLAPGPWDVPVQFAWRADARAPSGYDDIVTVTLQFPQAELWSSHLLAAMGMAQVVGNEFTVRVTKTTEQGAAY